jgi:2-oxoglutarate dehydrogenase E2 component (dihydrolipoamide succinyltransferase)
VVRRLLEEHHLDPAAIAGTGADGRITRDDVLAHVARTKGEAAPAAGGGDTVVPMSRIRKLTAERTARSAALSPHVLQAVEVDFSAVEAARTARGAAWKASEGFSLTYLPFVARAVCEAIREFPHVNASVSSDSLVVHGRVHLGVAVDLGFEGLVVPVVRDAQKRSLRELARELHALAEKARRRALLPDDVAGGTYTISNSGPFGTLITAPIIQQPQVAILSTDGVRKRPVAVEGPDGDAVAVHPVGVLAQCFDHRAFDGAYSAAFLKRLREILEGRDWSGELT